MGFFVKKVDDYYRLISATSSFVSRLCFDSLFYLQTRATSDIKCGLVCSDAHSIVYGKKAERCLNMIPEKCVPKTSLQNNNLALIIYNRTSFVSELTWR